MSATKCAWPWMALLLLLLVAGADRLGARPVPAAAPADGARYALIVQGASGEDQYATLHRRWTSELATLLRDRFRYGAANVVVVAERPASGEVPATSDGVRQAIARLAKILTPSDQLTVFLIGHGTGDGADAKFNLVGRDLTIPEWKALLDTVSARTIVVNTSSGSFPFVAGLAAKDRIVISATSTGAQKFHTQFPDALLKTLASTDTDLDKNNRLSFLEIFTQTSTLVKQYYEQKFAVATESPLLDDVGDGKGQTSTGPAASSRLASLTYLDAAPVITTNDPELQKLLTRQQALTEQIDDLRRRQASMSAETFTSQLEALLVELAEVSRDVRRRQGN